MNCPKCNEVMINKVGDCQYEECGLNNVRLLNWPLKACPNGHHSLPIVKVGESIIVLIVQHLVTQSERLTGDEIMFLRKELGKTSSELATILDVDRVTISRWENDHNEISPLGEFRLRLMAVDQILPQDMRNEARSLVTYVFQHRYTPNRVDGQIKLPHDEVPPAYMIAARLQRGEHRSVI